MAKVDILTLVKSSNILGAVGRKDGKDGEMIGHSNLYGLHFKMEIMHVK